MFMHYGRETVCVHNFAAYLSESGNLVLTDSINKLTKPGHVGTIQQLS